jgi:hypothetical protein
MLHVSPGKGWLVNSVLEIQLDNVYRDNDRSLSLPATIRFSRLELPLFTHIFVYLN